ncbi:Uncharacterised protein [Acinetobacter baumannii]|nr:Uncharacterised protein [Acinetobacter baumannii]
MPVIPGHYHCLTHVRVFRQTGLYLPGFNAEAADLDLVVVPSQEHQVAVRQVAGQIAGFIHPGAGNVTEGIGQEALVGQLRAVEVAPRHASAADIKLARRPQRDRLPLFI